MVRRLNNMKKMVYDGNFRRYLSVNYEFRDMLKDKFNGESEFRFVF